MHALAFLTLCSSTRTHSWPFTSISCSLQIDFIVFSRSLFSFLTFASGVLNEQSILLLFTLLQNPNFLLFVCTRSDLHSILSPLLEITYSSTGALRDLCAAILLILSQDRNFNLSCNSLEITQSWLPANSSSISLTSAISLILLRLIHTTLNSMESQQLHFNCIAALSNIAPFVKDIQAFVPIQLASLFKRLSLKTRKIQRVSGSSSQRSLS